MAKRTNMKIKEDLKTILAMAKQSTNLEQLATKTNLSISQIKTTLKQTDTDISVLLNQFEKNRAAKNNKSSETVNSETSHFDLNSVKNELIVLDFNCIFSNIFTKFLPKLLENNKLVIIPKTYIELKKLSKKNLVAKKMIELFHSQPESFIVDDSIQYNPKHSYKANIVKLCKKKHYSLLTTTKITEGLVKTYCVPEVSTFMKPKTITLKGVTYINGNLMIDSVRDIHIMERCILRTGEIIKPRYTITLQKDDIIYFVKRIGNSYYQFKKMKVINTYETNNALLLKNIKLFTYESYILDEDEKIFKQSVSQIENCSYFTYEYVDYFNNTLYFSAFKGRNSYCELKRNNTTIDDGVEKLQLNDELIIAIKLANSIVLKHIRIVKIAAENNAHYLLDTKIFPHDELISEYKGFLLRANEYFANQK